MWLDDVDYELKQYNEYIGHGDDDMTMMIIMIRVLHEDESDRCLSTIPLTCTLHLTSSRRDE
jgi:hypothetical protein